MMTDWPADANELHVRLAGWWSLNTWLLVEETPVCLTPRS